MNRSPSSSIMNDLREAPAGVAGGLWTWWAIRSRFEQVSVLLLACSAIVILSLSIAVGVKNSLLSRNAQAMDVVLVDGTQQDPVCSTAGCAVAAAELIEYLDDETDPCKDFYQFACGGWLEENPIEPHRAVVHVLHPMYDDVNKDYRQLFEEEDHPGDPVIFGSLRRYFRSCMNMKMINDVGDSVITDLLESYGGMPLLKGSAWKEDDFNMQDLLIKMHQDGLEISSLIRIGSMADYKDSSKKRIVVDQPSLPMGGRKILLNGPDDKRVRSYTKLLAEMVQLLGANKTTAEAEVLDFVKFQILLATISSDEKDRQKLSDMYHKFPINFLDKTCPSLKWIPLIRETVVDEDLDPDREEIIVKDINYLQGLDGVLKRTSKRTLANYMLMHVITRMMKYMGTKWHVLYEDFIGEVLGIKSVPPRWETCVRRVNSMAIATSAMFARRFMKDRTIKEAKEMVDFIVKEMKASVGNVTWMDDKVKLKAADKLKALEVLVGFPPEILRDEEIEKHYANFPYLRSDQYAKNTLSIAQWGHAKDRSEFRDPIKKKHWKSYAYATSMRTRFSQKDNMLVFPAGLFQTVFYDPDRPHYLNYGGVGSLVGRQLTHAVDTTGRQFDANGNNNDWWDRATETKYKDVAACMVHQYNEYQPDGKTSLNGRKLLVENAADASGLLRALGAYKDFMSGHPTLRREPRLPGLNYTQEQLFFISYASTQCMNIRPETLPLFVTYSKTASPRERVIGVLSNMPQFADAFGCSPTDEMVRKDKCKIW